MLRTSRERAQPLGVLLLLTKTAFYPEPIQKIVSYQKEIDLEFLFTPVTPFCASCSAQTNTHTCRMRSPLPTGPSVQQQEKHNSHSSTNVSEGQQVNCKDRLGVKTQGLLLLLLCVWEFLVASQRNKVAATTRPLLLPCDSIGSIASLSKSCLLFLSLCLMQHWLVLTAFFKNVLKYFVMHHNTYSKEPPDCTHYYRW